MGTLLILHARTNRTQDTRVAEPRLPAPEDGRPGEGQRLTPDAPHNGDRPPPPGDGPPPAPRHAAPTGHASQEDSPTAAHPHIRTHSTGRADPDSPPGGRAGGGGGATDLRRPSQRRKAPPLETPFRHPRSAQRRPAGAHAVGLMLGPHARTNRTRDTRVAEPRLPAPKAPPTGTPSRHPHSAQRRPRKGARREAGEPRPPAPGTGGSPRPHQPHPGHTGRGTPAARPRGRAARRGTAPDTTPGAGPPPPPRHAAPTGHASQGDSAGPPHPHTRAHSTWVVDPDNPPGGQEPGGGEAPDPRRPSQRRKTPPTGTPFHHPHSAQRRPARAHAVRQVHGPRAHNNRTRDTRVAEPWLPAPEDERPGEGQRLTPDAPHNGDRPGPPRGRPRTTPAARSPHRASKPSGQCWAPTPTHPRPQHADSGPWQPPGGGQPEEGERPASDAPRSGVTHATQTAGGAPNAHTHTRKLAREASVRAPQPTPRRTHSTYT